jgi:Insertion element 4 transposase N-terminal/Transposase DDE domain
LRIQSATATVTHVVTVAAGIFAPGHLGELTQYLPFELVDDVLEQTKTVQRRLRRLPSRAGVYFVLALGMFPRLGYARVWAKLTAGLAGLGLPCPSEKALRDLRRRLGPAPLKALFEVVAGPLAQPHTPGVRFAGLRTVAFDGLNSLKVPDTPRNRSWVGRIRYRMAWAGYPTLRLMALVETGTRALLGAAVGSVSSRDETALAARLLHLLRPGMLVLLDRGFDAGWFFAEIDRTGARLLCRGRAARNPQVREHLPDGSYLSCLDGLTVRIIEASVVATGADGTRIADSYRLITTLTDHRRYPAAALVRLYHERWEIESAYLALRHTLLNGRVLRSGDRPGVEQELWALLTLYQLLHMAMVTAVETRPGTNPDRASFTTALETASQELTAARGVCPAGPADLPGVIGRAVLATLLPARRPRYSARKIKAPTSRYQARDDTRPHTTTAITTIGITITTPPLDPRPRRPHRAPKEKTPRTPRPPTRRQRVTALMATQPHRDWPGRELAQRLQIKPRNLHTQLGEWAKLGFITRTGFATYALNTPPPRTPSTTGPDP